MLRRMISKFPGKCAVCRRPFKAGETIYWSRETKALCVECGSKQTTQTSEPTKTKSEFQPDALRQKVPPNRSEYFTIDYSDLKRVVSEALDGKEVCKRAKNNAEIRSHTVECREGFHGYTGSTLRRWIADGYEAPGITNLPDFSPPIREKRRYKYFEEPGELIVDRALSGEDSYFGDFTKQERIPGVAIEAEIMFAALVKPDVVNAYNVWICRAVKALESAGIDCQVSFRFSSENANPKTAWSHCVVRVKKENETADFRTFTPILSPAALRTFGFTALTLHAEREKVDVYGSLGHGRYNARPAPDWNVSFDRERGVILFDCPYMPREFPEERMTEALRKTVHELKNG